MHDALSYADLDALLSGLGFHPVSTTGPQKVFENPAYGALVILPPYAANEPVRPHHLVTVRKTVIEKGIIDEDAFGRLMAERLLSQV